MVKEPYHLVRRLDQMEVPMTTTNATDHRPSTVDEVPPARLVGVHHVAMLTQDLDRLVDFYREVLGVEVWLDLSEEGMRHVMLDLGGRASLHVLEQPENPHAVGRNAMFGRGHLDHVALMAADESSFDALRDLLVEVGASDGTVVDFGAVREITFTDPDGHELEVALAVPGGSPLAFADRVFEPYAT
jgi:catechol 2,3-dioxygenase-like lactoylglutathione lyase family enzyme